MPVRLLAARPADGARPVSIEGRQRALDRRRWISSSRRSLVVDVHGYLALAMGTFSSSQAIIAIARLTGGENT